MSTHCIGSDKLHPLSFPTTLIQLYIIACSFFEGHPPVNMHHSIMFIIHIPDHINSKPISIPLEQNVKLNADEGDLVEDTTMYRRIVGSLIYMTITRPNLSYAVGVVSQFMQTPRKPHLDAVRRILKYIKHTLQCGIFYEAKSHLQVHGYTDANWANNVLDRRSTNGFMFSFGSGGVSWSNKKQPTVALLSTEAEYRGATIVACEVVWLLKLLSNLGQLVDVLVVIYCDNISSILLVNNAIFHARTKHIEVHYHFIREKFLAKEIDLIHVSIEDQVVDIFTKALGIDKLKKFQKMLRVLEVDLSLKIQAQLVRFH